MKNLKQLLIYGTLLFLCEVSYSQVGIGTTLPDAALDVTSANDGLLIPRIALVNTTTSTVITPVESELVYNTATINDVTPGFYYWDGAKWVRLSTGSNNSWLTTGNSNIVDGTNYIGTDASTNVDVAFRRNNASAGKIAATSTSFGVGALNVGATTNSSAFGTNALKLNTGANNVAVGNGTLAANLTGTQNTGLGTSALAVNTGSASTAIGFETLKANTTGNNGTAIGFQALAKNTTASNNTAVGFQALTNNTTGTQNTAVGFQTLITNTIGNNNTAVGHIALNGNVNGSDNTGIGQSALGRNTGSRNTSIGFESMFGSAAAFSNTTAIGWHALFNNSVNESTAIGYQACNNNTTGTGNTAIGYSSLNNNLTGSSNTAVGNQAGFAISTSNNTLVGYFAGQFSTGANNTAVGANALKANGASSNSVAIGNNSLSINTAAANTAIGYSTLINNATGTGNVAIGNQAGFSETGSNKLYITNSNTTPTTSLIYGDFSGTRILRTNSTFQIGDPAGTGYVFPIARGTNTQYLASDASGVLSWTSPSGTNTLSATRTNLAANQSLNTTGWQKITYSNVVFDTNSEFASNKFTASKAGIFEINAGFHTDSQSNNQYYSIGVYVNGVLYQQNSSNHSGNGPVARDINCTVNLAVNDYVEIFVENYQASVNIDSFTGKTYFEVHQIR